MQTLIQPTVGNCLLRWQKWWPFCDCLMRWMLIADGRTFSLIKVLNVRYINYLWLVVLLISLSISGNTYFLKISIFVKQGVYKISLQIKENISDMFYCTPWLSNCIFVFLWCQKVQNSVFKVWNLCYISMSVCERKICM